MATDLRHMVTRHADGPDAEHAVQRQLLALDALSSLARQFASDPNFERFISTFLLTISGQFSANCASIFLPDASVSTGANGYFSASGALRCIEDSQEFIDLISAHSTALLELGCVRLDGDQASPEPVGELLDRLYGVGARMVATLHNGSDVIGLVGLSGKVTKQPYSNEDLEMMETMCNALSPLISNSLLFSHISHVNEWYLSILDSVQQGVFVFDHESVLRKVNAAGQALFRSLDRATGGTGRTIIGRPVDEVFPADVFPGWAVRVRIGNQRGGHRILDNSIARLGEIERIFSLQFSYVNDAEARQNNVVVTVDDVTAQRHSEQRLFDLQKFAEKGIMASSIAHEMNNFLGLILGGVELGQIAMRKGNFEKLESTLEKLKVNVKKMERFTAGLTDFTKLNTQKSQADINEVIQDVISFTSVQKRFKGLEIRTDLDPSLPTILLDKDQIAQLLLNFMNNAADAIIEAQRGDEGLIRIRTEYDGSALSFSVQDNGVGIDPAIQDTLFKVHMTTKEKGHGYGLVTCAKIIENHDARIRIDSTKGKGSTFIVSIPAAG